MAQFQQQIAASLDDTYANQYGNNPTAANALFGKTYYYKTTYYLHSSFLRFLLDIPVGATITSAIITLVAYTSRTDDFTAQINFTDENDAVAFDTNPYAKADGGTNVAWTVPDFVAGQNVQTADITSLIQTFIERGGYVANNHIAIRIKYGDAANGEYQNFYQWNGDSAKAAILTVEYSVAGKTFSQGHIIG